MQAWTIALLVALSGCTNAMTGSEVRDSLADDDGFCQEWISKGAFKDKRDCHWAMRHPEEWRCQQETKSNDEYEKCMWPVRHPIEARCEKEAKIHGGYWECVRVGQEREDREKDRAQARRIHDEDAAEDRRQRAADSLRDAVGSYGDNLQRARQAPQKTKCVTKKSWTGDELVTECQ